LFHRYCGFSTENISHPTPIPREIWGIPAGQSNDTVVKKLKKTKIVFAAEVGTGLQQSNE